MPESCFYFMHVCSALLCSAVFSCSKRHPRRSRVQHKPPTHSLSQLPTAARIGVLATHAANPLLLSVSLRPSLSDGIVLRHSCCRRHLEYLRAKCDSGKGRGIGSLAPSVLFSFSWFLPLIGLSWQGKRGDILRFIYIISLP